VVCYGAPEWYRYSALGFVDENMHDDFTQGLAVMGNPMTREPVYKLKEPQS
jgi:hypothetical protein